MKCVCGYEKIGSQIVDGKYGDVDPEKEDFRELEVTIEEMVDLRGWRENVIKRVMLFACPECGTLKVDN